MDFVMIDGCKVGVVDGWYIAHDAKVAMEIQQPLIQIMNKLNADEKKQTDMRWRGQNRTALWLVNDIGLRKMANCADEKYLSQVNQITSASSEEI